MTEMSRERREALLERMDREIRECGSEETIVTATDRLKCGELRALLRDSAWRERVESQVRELADRLDQEEEETRLKWHPKSPSGGKSTWMRYASVIGNRSAELRAIVDTGDEETNPESGHYGSNLDDFEHKNGV